MIEDAFTTLVSAALLGTDRRTPPRPSSPIADEVDLHADPAVGLLDHAAALVAARRAGIRPRRPPAPIAPAPPTDRAPCPPSAARRMAELLADPDLVYGPGPAIVLPLVAEWLAALARRRCALPPELLVPLATRVRAHPALVAMALDAAGPLVAWFDGLMPGVLPARPAAATALPTAPTPARTIAAAAPASVATVATATTEDDLERLLGHRSATVRAQAIAVLAATSGSRYQARMIERVGALVQPGQRGPAALAAPPSSPPADWVRDGIDPQPPAGTARSIHVLRQLAALAPLAAWSVVAADAPGAVAWAARLGDPLVTTALIDGWSVAARRERSQSWATAIVLPPVDGLPPADPTLAEVLDEPALVLVAHHLLDQDRLLGPLSRAVLGRLATPWPAQLAERVLTEASEMLVDGRVIPKQRPALNELVLRLDPLLLQRFATAIRPPDTTLAPSPVEALRFDLADLAILRHDLLEELR